MTGCISTEPRHKQDGNTYKAHEQWNKYKNIANY